MYIFILVIIFLLFSNTRKETFSSIRNHQVIAKFAKTNSQIKKGLMFVKKPLPVNEGMLFFMKRKARHSFWMKNTFIPLDMIFLDEKYRVIGFLQNIKPHDLTLKSIKKPSNYVLEMNAGWVKKNNVKINDIINIKQKIEDM